jgi:hypoxia-inducible factor 1 alpha
MKKSVEKFSCGISVKKNFQNENLTEKLFVNFSGLENEHEILSCAQLEAQQELNKIETNPIDVKSASDIIIEQKVVKRDNIVLGITDLKPHQQKRFDNSKKIIAVNKTQQENQSKLIVGQQIVINPSDIVKVNNCEIVSRPRSVTASIFTTSNTTAKPIARPSVKPTTNATKTRASSSTSKIFRQNPQNVTSTIFARRTEDMNKGFLMFSEDDAALTSEYDMRLHFHDPSRMTDSFAKSIDEYKPNVIQHEV